MFLFESTVTMTEHLSHAHTHMCEVTCALPLHRHTQTDSPPSSLPLSLFTERFYKNDPNTLYKGDHGIDPWNRPTDNTWNWFQFYSIWFVQILFALKQHNISNLHFISEMTNWTPDDDHRLLGRNSVSIITFLSTKSKTIVRNYSRIRTFLVSKLLQKSC